MNENKIATKPVGRLRIFLDRLKKKKILIPLIIVGGGLVLTSGGLLTSQLLKKPPAEPPAEPIVEPPKPVLLPSTLNGVLVSPEIANRRAIAVIIDNHPVARPQTGLKNADLVFEALVEGGFTRFLAFFQQDVVTQAGPVRSARSYFADFVKEHDAIFVYSGTSPGANSRIINLGVKGYPHANDGNFRRIPRPGLASEHTLFANLKGIFEQVTIARNWSHDYNLEPWKFTDPNVANPDPATTRSIVTIPYSTRQFQVDWIFNPDTKRYARLVAGQPHLDALSGEPISAETVIVMTVARQPNPPYAGGRESEWSMTTVGSGPVKIYHSNQELIGTWQRASHGDRTRFLDSAGQPIALRPGKIWVQIVPPTVVSSLRTEPIVPPVPPPAD